MYCKGTNCPNYPEKYAFVFCGKDEETGERIYRYEKVKRSCYNEPGCWRGDLDMLIEIFQISKENRIEKL